MSVNELSWRKFPRDTMRNEELDYCAYLLGTDLAAAPFLFFTTAYCKADDEGVFDIEDGVIFSRLMRLGTPSDVHKIATLLEERKIITRVIPGGSVFMLTEWDPPQRPGSYSNKSRTAEERRRAVAAKIEAENKNKQQEVYVNFNRTTQPADFFCPDVDKNAKSVDRQREIERENIEINRHTHTQNKTYQTDRLRESEGFHAYEALQPCAEKKVEPQETVEHKTTENMAAIALSDSNGNVCDNEQSVIGNNENVQMSSELLQVCEVFSSFFAKNCLGYNEGSEKSKIITLAQRIIKLKDKKNPPGIIASVFCSQYKQLSEAEGHFKNVPISATMLLNPHVYAQVTSRASKVLFTKGANKDWQEQMDIDRLEAEADRPAVYDEIKNECLKYNIDPNDENVWYKIMLAKKQQAIK